MTQIKAVYFNIPIQNPVLIGFLKIIDAQNKIPVRFGTALVCNKILKVRNSSDSNTNF
jgi:hypothetical protein